MMPTVLPNRILSFQKLKSTIDLPIWLYKVFNYEYWPSWLMYTLISPYIFYLAFRARSPLFFTNVNPAIRMSGLINYSKHNVLQMLPKTLVPNSYLVRQGDQLEDLPSALHFPIIAKPDKGERGQGVAKIENTLQLQEYLASTKQATILQQYVEYPFEAAVFYVRKPGETHGVITSFTTKEFLSVVGDGMSTVRQLMEAKFRSKMQIARMPPSVLSSIPSLGEHRLMEPIGNHSRGTRFLNANAKISGSLVATFDHLSQGVEGFYYGRYDLKYKDLDSLSRGIDYKIVELNGVNSEPVHIYDQSTGVFQAFRDLCVHWKLIFLIGQENEQRGFPYASVRDFMKVLFDR